MPVVLLKCQVSPKAKKSEVLGWINDGQGVRRLKIKLAAPPVDGKANRELVKFLGSELSLPKNRLKLVAGEKSRLKTVRISGLDEEGVEALFPGSG